MKKLFAAIFLSSFFILAVIADNPHKPATPIIVASQSFLSQTASLPLTAIFTPTSAGQYRLQVYVEALPSGTLSPSAQWTDDFGTNSAVIASTTNYNASDAVAKVIWPIYSVAGQPISFSVAVDPNTTTTYNAYVLVEQLE